MSRQLTKKQRKFVKEYAKSGNGTKSALKAYDTTDYATAQAIASENLLKPLVVKSLNEALSDELLEKVHIEGLNAKQFRFSPEGELMQLDDFNVRSKYLDMAYKRRGDYAPEKHVSVTIDANTTGRVDSILDRLTNRRREGTTR